MSYNLGLKFYDVAIQRKEHICLKYLEGSNYSFAELDKKSNQIGRWMIKRGLTKGSVIGLLSNKSFLSFATMIACLKTGIIYTNLDPFSPPSRLFKIIERCEPRIILSDFADTPLKSNQTNVKCQVQYFEQLEFTQALDAIDDDRLLETASVCGTDPAYIMFTSGSTGFPKGAVMNHSNLISFLEWSISITKPTDKDVFTNVNPIYFDNSVFDFYTATFSGSTLTPLTADVTKNPETLVKAIDKLACTIWFSVPSLLVYLLTTRMLKKDNMKQLRLFIFGGEGFPKPKLKELFDLYNDRASLLNVYGPTECTCICSEYFISENDFSELSSLAPLGHLTKNFFYEIVDEKMNSSDSGELLLGGPNVGSGYYSDPERSISAFIQNPTHDKYRDTMYRTGDLVKRDDHGLIHFKGRADNQIKHMGYRIELEEIEAGLNTLPSVKEAAVVYKKLGPGMGQIIGFVASDFEIESNNILEGIRGIVPDYMVPRKINILKELPKNHNGKIDRNALKS